MGWVSFWASDRRNGDWTIAFDGVGAKVDAMWNSPDRARRVAAVALLIGGICTAWTPSASAQGLSGAAIEGIVVTGTGTPVRGALVTLTESATSAARAATTGESGISRFENVLVGLYDIEAKAIGLLPASARGIALHVGDHARIRLVLKSPVAQNIGEVTVKGATLRDPGAGGPASSIPREAIQSLPLLNRNFVDLFAMSPQAIGPGSLWVSGQHSRFNAIQIDGAIGNDLFGVNVTPGSGAGARSISLEALREIRILVAPFDVRQGGFSGGLINAVTRSGSNSLHGAVFSSHSRSEFVGADTAGAGVATFDQLQYGVSVGGPIVRDRIHYFAVAEGQSKTTRFTGPSVNEPATGVSEATALRASQVFREKYGFDPGGPEAPDLGQPNGNLFLKLSWHPSLNHAMELTQAFNKARSDGLNRESRNLNNVDGWQLSNSGPVSRFINYGAHFKALSSIGALTNEMILGATNIEIAINSRNRVPLFIVQADLPNHYLAGGSTKAAQGTLTTQRVYELTDNVSWSGGAHLITLGTQNVVVRIRDNFFLGSWGVWSFANVDALERKDASLYEVALPLTERGPLADYSSALMSVYMQDQWRPRDRVSVTVGLRADVPFFDAPPSNQILKSNEKLGGIDTGNFPSGNAVFAPRIGFSWELGTERRSMLRGGAGAFTGRPPLAWLTGAFSSTGQEQTILVCRRADGVPAPTTDVDNLPSRCLNAAAGPGRPSVNYFDSRFRFQQAIKYAAGFDHAFAESFVASVDVIHTRSRNNTIVNDVNLAERGVNGEGRTMYGSITSAGVARPTRIDSVGFGAIHQYANVSTDRSTSISLSARQTWRSGGFLHFGYDWSRTMDIMSMTGFISTVILRNNPVDGTLSRRELRRSGRDIPHSLVATAIVPVGFGITASGYFRIRSGTPYAVTVSGDANADGTARNDLAYIPRDAGDISLANPDVYPALDAFIQSQPCLRRQRGRLVTRNSCRNPRVYLLDGRIAKKLWTGDARGFEIVADLFNVANMLNRSWGLVRETTSREDAPLLPVSGWDLARNRPRYSIPVSANGQPVLLPLNKVVADASRWRVQLGVRYDF